MSQVGNLQVALIIYTSIVATFCRLPVGNTADWQSALRGLRSYDHWIRNEEEKARIRRYIRMNPVKAGLCESPEDWKWGSAWPGWNAAEASA